MIVLPVESTGIVCIWKIKKEFVFACVCACNIKELYDHKKIIDKCKNNCYIICFSQNKNVFLQCRADHNKK